MRTFLAKVAATSLSTCIALGPAVSRASAQITGQVNWNVEDNFRLLKDSQDQQWLKTLSLESEDPRFARIRLSQLQTQWKAVPDTYYDESNNRYSPDYVNPKNRTWTIKVSSSSAKYGEDCTWSIGGQMRMASCHDYVPDIQISQRSTIVSATTRDGITDSTTILVKDKLFVAVGDSFSSGEGQPDVMRLAQKRKADWWDNKCHRSLYAWPVLTAARYAQMHPHESVTFVSRACSGALFKDVTGLTPSSTDPNTDIPAIPSEGSGGEERRSVGGSRFLQPQITQLALDLCKVELVNDSCPSGQVRRPDYILMSIGGNDAAFAKTIIDGLLGRINKGIELKDELRKRTSTSVDFLEREYRKLPALMRAVFDDAPVIMTVYPDPLHITSRFFCGFENDKKSATINGARTLYLPTYDIGFTANGLEAFLLRLLNKRITEEEVVAIHDDYYLRLTGRKFPNDNEIKDNGLRRDYRGMRSIGYELMAKYPGVWTVVETNSNYPQGRIKSPYGENRDTDQFPCYRPMGYCRSGNSAMGRWFLNLTDSLDRIGNIYGAMHPNIYGQLYYVSKVYPSLPGVKGKVKSVSLFKENTQPIEQKCPAGNSLLDLDERNFRCLIR